MTSDRTGDMTGDMTGETTGETIGESCHREQLVAANEDAADFFRHQLRGPDGDGPRRYLIQRGFEALLVPDTPWTVGYAPAGWTTLHDHLSDLGYSDDCQLAAGLVSRCRRGTLIDRFRDRITFGVHHADHTLIGFVARTSPASPPTLPKYLNTPTTALYNKSHALFGLGEQEPALRAGATPVFVEGPLDAIAIDLASFSENASHAGLALCGTALTEHHRDAALIGNQANASLVFDADPAGRTALRNAYDRLHTHVEHVVAIGLAPGSDPAELFARGGPTAVRRALQNPRPAADVIIDNQLASWPPTQTGAEADLARLREAAALIIDIDSAQIAHHAARLSRLMPHGNATIAHELADALTRARRLPSSTQPPDQSASRLNGRGYSARSLG
jgi:DNA primase catalytic core